MCIGIQKVYIHMQPGSRHTILDLLTIFLPILNDSVKDILQYLGGVDNNSLINILEIDINENLDSDQPQLM